MDRALLVAANLPDSLYEIEYSLQELKALAEACDIETIDVVTQNLDRINPKYYIGSGKVEEIKMLIADKDINIVVFNDELSPSQIDNIEDVLDVKVVDRTLLVLDIFAKRANTQESILEVELAQLRYMLPRLSGLDKSLSRQGGSNFNAKGPGEKKIELDRRLITKDIVAIEAKLSKIKASRMLQRERRKNNLIPVVSLVGYTNAGKSSTMNNLLKMCQKGEKEVFEKDMLFATLNTSARRIKLPNNFEFILLDTVGFVSQLPHHLINSFRSTLEEVLDSDLILHIVDISDPNYRDEMKVTNELLESLGALSIPKKMVYTKIDKVENPPMFLESGILYSNKTLVGQDELFKAITDELEKDFTKEMEIYVPYTDGKIISILDGFAITQVKIMMQDSIYYKGRIPLEYYELIRPYQRKEVI